MKDNKQFTRRVFKPLFEITHLKVDSLLIRFWLLEGFDIDKDMNISFI